MIEKKFSFDWTSRNKVDVRKLSFSALVSCNRVPYLQRLTSGALRKTQVFAFGDQGEASTRANGHLRRRSQLYYLPRWPQNQISDSTLLS